MSSRTGPTHRRATRRPRSRGRAAVHHGRVAAALCCAGALVLAALQPASPAAANAARSSLAGFELVQTAPVCELLGLGAVGSVPFNFPGASDDVLGGYRRHVHVPEASLPAGDHPDPPLVFGIDMGAPFAHADGRIHFLFDDALVAPPEGRSGTDCNVDDPACTPRTVADDLLASAPSDGWTSANDCIDLSIPTSAVDPARFEPLTWNRADSPDAVDLGPGVVPGPGFSTGRYIFSVMPGPALTCSPERDDCAAVGGIEGDRCLSASPSTGAAAPGRCYFGACDGTPGSACALRLGNATLAVLDRHSHFVEPTVGVHIESRAVLQAYRGHFATVSFFSRVDFQTGDGTVWVLGRDSYWGAPGLTMSPYLMYHEVHDGVLSQPRYFAGMHHGHPVFSRDRTDAKPLYREDKLLPNHSSLAYVPELDGGTWVIMYGGHAQPVLQPMIGLFVQPVSDALFYDRDAGVYLRWAKRPWGPWSPAVTLFDPYTPGQGGYCEQMYFEDPDGRTDFHCPFDSAAHNQSLNRRPSAGMAGEYGVAIVPSYASVADSGSVTLHWLMSTWNPYRVMLMKSELRAQHDDAVAPRR